MRETRTKQCDRAFAVARLEQAFSFVEHAALDTYSERGPARSAAVSNVALAAIAASDAICCSVLGKRSARWDHRDTLLLLRSVPVIGKQAEYRLRMLLAIKDKAQYHRGDPNMADAKRSIRATDADVILGSPFAKLGWSFGRRRFWLRR